MPLLACPACQRTTEQPVTGVCVNCRNRLSGWLQEIEETWHTAHNCLEPQVGSRSGGGSERKIGVSVAALSWVEGSPILGVIHSWEQLIREERGLVKVGHLKPLCLSDSIRAAFHFQRAHLNWIVDQPFANDYYLEIRDLLHAGKAACHQIEEGHARIMCPGELAEGGECGHRLPLTGDMHAEIHCKRCGTVWSVAWLVKVALSNQTSDVWVDGEAVAEWLNVTSRTLRTWATNGFVRRKGNSYALRDVQACVARPLAVANV